MYISPPCPGEGNGDEAISYFTLPLLLLASVPLPSREGVNGKKYI
jgi:hypothetical protein